METALRSGTIPVRAFPEHRLAFVLIEQRLGSSASIALLLGTIRIGRELFTEVEVDFASLKAFLIKNNIVPWYVEPYVDDPKSKKFSIGAESALGGWFGEQPGYPVQTKSEVKDLIEAKKHPLWKRFYSDSGDLRNYRRAFDRQWQLHAPKPWHAPGKRKQPNQITAPD